MDNTAAMKKRNQYIYQIFQNLIVFCRVGMKKVFAGVIHSHPLDMRKLSAADVVYANCIMKENGLKYVHFPLVFPDDGTIIWYEVSSGGAVNELTYEVEKDF